MLLLKIHYYQQNLSIKSLSNFKGQEIILIQNKKRAFKSLVFRPQTVGTPYIYLLYLRESQQFIMVTKEFLVSRMCVKNSMSMGMQITIENNKITTSKIFISKSK